MSIETLYACVHAAEFPAQALLRLRQDLQSEPVAVIDGRPPHESVCAVNRSAVHKGAVIGMTRLDVEGLGGVSLLARSQATEQPHAKSCWSVCLDFLHALKKRAAERRARLCSTLQAVNVCLVPATACRPHAFCIARIRLSRFHCHKQQLRHGAHESHTYTRHPVNP